jgi:hypothetical protein
MVEPVTCACSRSRTAGPDRLGGRGVLGRQRSSRIWTSLRAFDAELTENTESQHECAPRASESLDASEMLWEQLFQQKVSGDARGDDRCNRRTPRPLRAIRQ